MAHPDKPHLDRVPKRWNPALWASKVPFGIGEQHPNNFAEITRAIRENKDELPFAWRILHEGVCDGCALGVAGLKDWTTDGPHLCNIRLRLLRLNTMPALDIDLLADVAPLRKKKSAELRELGRLPYPMIRRKGDRGFHRISWDEALDVTADRIKATSPDRLGFYLTGRGTVNETYYAAQKAVRALGTNSIDNAARICHAPSSVALKQTIGVGATTCSYSDWIGTDLLVFIGANPANNQPVTTKYLHYAKKAGTKVVLVNPYREPGMERYWVPSIPESALFGTKIANDTVSRHPGGRYRLSLRCAQTHPRARSGRSRLHRRTHHRLPRAKSQHRSDELEGPRSQQRPLRTTRCASSVSSSDRPKPRSSSGVWVSPSTPPARTACAPSSIWPSPRGSLGATSAVSCRSAGIPASRAARRWAPIRPPSRATFAISAEAAAALGTHWGFEVPSEKGMITSEMIDAADRGELDVLFAAGSNFLEVLPDPVYIDQALGKIPLRVHQDIVLTSQMFIDPVDTVLLLPAATRYETPGGVTQRSTERRVMFSPEIDGRRIGEARPEWEIFLDLARRVRPDLRMQLSYPSTQEIREEIAQIVPAYDGIQRLPQDRRPIPGRRQASLRALGLPDQRRQSRISFRSASPIARSPRALSTFPPAAASSSTA